MGVDLQGSHRHGRRTCGVVSTAWRTAAIVRSGASSGIRSSQARSDAVEVAVVGHAIRPSGMTGAASASMAARSALVA